VKRILSLSALAVLSTSLLVSCQKPSATGVSKVELKTDDEKVFYTIGHMYGARMKDLQLSDSEIHAMVAGMSDATKGEKEQVDVNAFQKQVQTVFQKRLESQAVKNKETGDKFVADFLKEEGAMKTESGLAYKITAAGSDKKPKETDEVEVHYHGTLIDGTVFDSSVERGKTVTFPLNRVIKGWTEGLQLIGEGGKVKLVIPSELAYGEHGAPPKIPGGATLVFEVELVKVAPPQAAENTKKMPKKKK